MFSRLSGSVLAAASLVLLSSCGAQDQASSAESEQAGAEDSELLIVASIDVYADLASQVVQDTAEVEAIVDNPAVDPHSYEATPQDRLLVDQADVLIANGGGYDAFITLLASSAEQEEQVYQLIPGENEHSHGEDQEHDHSEDEDSHEGEHSHEEEAVYENEHIWYDLPRMSEFVVDFGEHMGQLLPEHAEQYTQNAEELAAEIDALAERVEDLEAEGMAYLATEAVSGLLLQDAGFEDLTDVQFLSAVEHGDDVSPRLYQQALETVGGDEISMLAYNPQTETSQSSRIREAAEQNEVEELEFSETIPEEFDSYTEWMSETIDRLEQLVEDPA